MLLPEGLRDSQAERARGVVVVDGRAVELDEEAGVEGVCPHAPLQAALGQAHVAEPPLARSVGDGQDADDVREEPQVAAEVSVDASVQ